MYSYGGASGHGNAIKFGDLNALDAPSVYTLAFWVTVNLLPLGASDTMIAKADGAAADGWSVSVLTDGELQVRHTDTTSDTATSVTANITTGYSSIVIMWDGATHCHFFQNGGSAESIALTKSIGANATDMTVGNYSNHSGGAAVRLGHVMWWDVALTTQEAQSWHAGIIANPADLKFWAPGWTDSGIELIGQATSAKTGTVTIKEDKFKSVPYFFGQCGYLPHSMHRIFKEYTEQADITDENAVGLPTFINKLAVADSEGLRDGETSGDSKWDPDGNIIETMSDGTVWTKDKFPPYAKRNIWTED